MRFGVYNSPLHVRYLCDIFIYSIREEFSNPIILSCQRPNT